MQRVSKELAREKLIGKTVYAGSQGRHGSIVAKLVKYTTE